jgi:hypothetical protein
MSPLTLVAIQRNNLRCHDCNKRLTKRTIAYREFTFPMGTMELVPVCKACKREASKIG